MRVVPLLVMELIKLQPKNRAELEKVFKFWRSTFKWYPKGMSREEETAKKYLSVLKTLRGQLDACQEAASTSTSEVEPTKVGKFSLHDSLGLDEATKRTVIDTIEKAANAMKDIGLGEYCYGNVTIVDSSKFASKSAAFYVQNTDEVYLSPNLHGEDIRALCHELAHRVHTKLNLGTKSKELYQIVKDRGTWVTGYAKTNPEENFCEMVSFAAVKASTGGFQGTPDGSSTQDQARLESRLQVSWSDMTVWTLYIIQSTVHGKLYTGISTDPDRRLDQHNAGKGAKFTRVGGPWVTVYREVIGPVKGDALRRERAVKRMSRSQKLRLAHP